MKYTENFEDGFSFFIRSILRLTKHQLKGDVRESFPYSDICRPKTLVVLFYCTKEPNRELIIVERK